MTIKIEIEVPSDLVLKGAGSMYLDQAAGALGWSRASNVSHDVTQETQPFLTKEQVRDIEDPAPQAIVEASEQLQDALDEQKATEAADIDTRLVGQPSPGKSRRNSAEKAEDDELEALAAEKGVAIADLDAGIAGLGRAEARKRLEEARDKAEELATDKPAISTGEERVGPDDAQDAADEAAETEKTGLAPIDVLRRLVGDYQKKHGMPAAVKLCQDGGLIGKPIHELDDAGIEAAIAAMQGEPAPANAEEKEAPVEPKTKADLVEAMMRYADKFDGTREQAKMKATLEDCPRIFIDTFGPDVQKLSQVPEDGYGKAVAAIEAAIEADPYGRAK